MPVTLTLDKKVSDSLWSASGTFINDQDAENVITHSAVGIKVKQDGDKLTLHAEPDSDNGTVGGFEVLHFDQGEPLIIDAPGVGTKLVFKQILTTVKI